MPFPPNPSPNPEPASAPSWPADAAAPPTDAPDPAFRRYKRLPAPRPWALARHLGLLLLTVATATLAGVTLTRGDVGLLAVDVLALPAALRDAELRRGLLYALPFLGVLTVHEFGHYFVARAHRIRTTLPYYIPFPLGLGTFGAIIRIKDRIFSRREFFDVGLAGPLAGFGAALGLLMYGFTHLPPLDYLFSIHPQYAAYGADYARHVYPPGAAGQGLTLARPLLYQWLEAALADPARLPHPNELLHYPLLLAGALSLFFTALNLLPLGQLDGGHILYALLGPRRFNRLALWLFVGFLFYAGLGLLTVHDDWQTWLWAGPTYAAYLALACWRLLPTPRRGLLLGAGIWAAQLAVGAAWPDVLGNPGWLIFGLLLGRVVGIYHPPAPDERPLGRGRQLLGWLMLGIFAVCFTPSPFK